MSVGKERRSPKRGENKGHVTSSPAFVHLGLDLVVPEAEVLQVGGRVGLDRRELVLQHLDHLRQLWVPPAELPGDEDRPSGHVHGPGGSMQTRASARDSSARVPCCFCGDV